MRLPYFVHDSNWKEKIVPLAHKVMHEVIKQRPDIGIMTLFPDQIRSFFCDKFGNRWSTSFVKEFGGENITKMMLDTERYMNLYKHKDEVDPSLLPEPLRREHYRTKEDMAMISAAILNRKKYEKLRFEQV
ncbi:MAG: hypothetical protein HQK51_06300 [Oligoflexia bacterium]|nr:hypothetical protein [Oligoflexia bacterium]